MRFRLGTTGAQQQNPLASGIGNAVRTFAMLPLMQAQAAEEGRLAQSTFDLRDAQQRQADAHAALFQQQAEDLRVQRQRGSLGETLRNAALQNGVPLHQVDEFAGFAQTGKLPGQFVQPPADLGGGPALPAPAYADPDLGRRIFQTLGLTQNALAQGDKSVENVAKAAGVYQDQGIERSAVDAAARGDDMALSRLNAIRGKKEFTPFAAVGNTGTALNQVTGAQPVTNQALNVLFGRGEQAQIYQRNAAAGASNAAAENSRASAEKTRLETKNLLEGKGKGSLTSPKDRFEAENKLRDEFQKQNQTFVKVRDAFAKVNVAAKDPNAASDIALIFSFMRILDPDSVVREGEFATAQNAAGVPDRIINLYNRALRGERLNDVQRTNFVNEARKVYREQETGMKQVEKNYTELANRYGLDVKNIVTPFAPVEEGGGGKVVDFNTLGGSGAAGSAKVIDFGGLK